MSDITVINDSEQSSLVTNGLAKNGELYLKASGSTDAGAVVVYDSGSWRTFANEFSAVLSNAYSVDFDGTNDYIWVGSQTELNLTSNFSLSTWVKADSFPSNGSWLLSKRDHDGSAHINFQLVIYNRYIYLATSTVSSLQSTSQISGDTWYNIVCTVNPGTEAKIYINGSLDKTGSITAVQNANTPLSIGAWTNNTGGIYGPHDGLIDEAAVFDSLLSASDITAIYNSGVPTDLTSYSPVGWWRMGDNDGGTGTTITDQGSGGNDGTLTNGPTFSSSVPS